MQGTVATKIWGWHVGSACALGGGSSVYSDSSSSSSSSSDSKEPRGWDGDGSVSMTVPEAPSPEVLLRTCQGVSGSPAMDSGRQGHRRPLTTQAQ